MSCHDSPRHYRRGMSCWTKVSSPRRPNKNMPPCWQNANNRCSFNQLCRTTRTNFAPAWPRIERNMTVAEIFMRHVASELSQYRGNFQFLEKVLQAGEMPDAAEPTARAYVAELKQFLSTQGVQETD